MTIPAAATLRSGADPAGHDFDQFYAAKFDMLRAQLHAYLGDRAEAQDLVQEAFCRAYSRWQRICAYDDPYGWVRRVAWNLATSRLRRQRTAMRFMARQREKEQSYIKILREAEKDYGHTPECRRNRHHQTVTINPFCPAGG